MALNKRIVLPSLLIIVGLGCVRFWLASYLPIVGDGALHAIYVEGIMESGVLPSFPNYPPLFHLEGGILGLFVGMDYQFLPALAGVLTVVILYLFTKELIGSEVVALLVAFFAAVYPYHMLFSSVFFMETTMVMFIFLTLYAHIKYLKTNKIQWLLLTGIFLGTSIAIKQIAYILPAIILLQHLVFKIKFRDLMPTLRASVKPIAAIVLIAMIVCIPCLIYLYQATGTILQPTSPYLGSTTLAVDPRAVEIFETEFSFAHLAPYTGDEATRFYNPSTYFYDPYHPWNYHLPEALFIALALLGALYLAYKRPRAFLYLIIFVGLYFLFMTQLQTSKYFIHSKLIVLVFMCSAILLPMRFLDRKKLAALLLIPLLIIPASNLYTAGIQDTESRYNSMCWIPTREPITNLIDASEWIKDHSNEDDVIACPDVYEVEYYSERKAFWLSYFEGVDFYIALTTHDSDLLASEFDRNKIRYILFINRLITTERPNTQHFTRYEDYLFIKDSPMFELVFEKPGVEVYEFQGVSK